MIHVLAVFVVAALAWGFRKHLVEIAVAMVAVAWIMWNGKG